jgi:hypothetical protein
VRNVRLLSANGRRNEPNEAKAPLLSSRGLLAGACSALRLEFQFSTELRRNCAPASKISEKLFGENRSVAPKHGWVLDNSTVVREGPTEFPDGNCAMFCGVTGETVLPLQALSASQKPFQSDAHKRQEQAESNSISWQESAVYDTALAPARRPPFNLIMLAS